MFVLYLGFRLRDFPETPDFAILAHALQALEMELQSVNS
jgi:hypothetical protein